MPIVLTKEQEDQLAAAGETHPRVIDPLTKSVYVLVPVAEYESVRKLIEEERQQRIIHDMGMRNAARRADEEL